jgi:DNA polymerase
MWHATEHAACEALRNPGTAYTAGRLILKVTKYRNLLWLAMSLPSGRMLCYFNPQLKDNNISYEGHVQTSKSGRIWTRVDTYGGKLIENATQAIARDVMAHNMLDMEQKGYPVVMAVHDEVVSEVNDNPMYNDKELSRLLTRVPSWGDGLPLAASGYTAKRYRKD